MAAVRGLQTTDRRKAALLRHIWRPRRFRALLDRFAGARADAARARPAARHTAPGRARGADGRRRASSSACASPEEVAARARALIEDAAHATDPRRRGGHARRPACRCPRPPPRRWPICATSRSTCPPSARRWTASPTGWRRWRRCGIDVDSLPFEASHGRTTLEYYDGFVFSFHADRTGWPPVAVGRAL